jgi:hypothetical protein
MAVGGGLPLFHDKKLIGGIGVSGGSHEQDQQAASAALGRVASDLKLMRAYSRVGTIYVTTILFFWTESSSRRKSTGFLL